MWPFLRHYPGYTVPVSHGPVYDLTAYYNHQNVAAISRTAVQEQTRTQLSTVSTKTYGEILKLYQTPYKISTEKRKSVSANINQLHKIRKSASHVHDQLPSGHMKMIGATMNRSLAPQPSHGAKNDSGKSCVKTIRKKSTKILAANRLCCNTVNHNGLSSPVQEVDFKLYSDDHIITGSMSPTVSNQTTILMTNVSYEINNPDTLRKIIKRFGKIKDLQCRLLKRKHIAAVEFTDHTGALKFFKYSGKLFRNHPYIKKYWWKVTDIPVTTSVSCSNLPSPNLNNPSHQSHLNQPTTNLEVSAHKLPAVDIFKPPSSTALQLIAAQTVPTLEELQPYTMNIQSATSRRKPVLKLVSKSKKDVIEIIDLDPCLPPVTFCSTSSDTTNQSTFGCETPKSDPVERLADPDIPTETQTSLKVGQTPAGAILDPYSFKILSPVILGKQKLLTGSLTPVEQYSKTLILRGIPYELNTKSYLRPALLKFGRCALKSRYLGLRTTACVEYFNQYEAAACFKSVYKFLKLEYLKVFWMDSLPLLESELSPGKPNNTIDEIEIPPASISGPTRGKRCRRRHRNSRKRFNPGLMSWVWNRQNVDRTSNSHKGKLIAKNQSLLSTSIKNQKLILNKLGHCKDPKIKASLLTMLKKLEKAHHTTSSNLKMLHSSNNNPSKESIYSLTHVSTNPLIPVLPPVLPHVLPPVLPPAKELSSDHHVIPDHSKSMLDSSAPAQSKPTQIKVSNFYNETILYNHFRKFGICSSCVTPCGAIIFKFEKRKAAVLAFVKGHVITWLENGIKYEHQLVMEWDFTDLTQPGSCAIPSETSGIGPSCSKSAS